MVHRKDAYRIARKYKLINPRCRRWQFGWIKQIMCPHSTWAEFLKTLCLGRYLELKGYEPLPPEGVYIPELKLQIGGTLNLSTGKMIKEN